MPVFISGALQDEQTGPQWPVLLGAFPATTRVYANLVNGDHIDSTDPQIIGRWLEFLDLYVADRVPTPPNALTRTVLDKFTSFASGSVRAGPAAAHTFHDRSDGEPGTGRVRSGNPTGAGPLRQRERCGGGW